MAFAGYRYVDQGGKKVTKATVLGSNTSKTFDITAVRSCSAAVLFSASGGLGACMGCPLPFKYIIWKIVFLTWGGQLALWHQLAAKRLFYALENLQGSQGERSMCTLMHANIHYQSELQ